MLELVSKMNRFYQAHGIGRRIAGLAVYLCSEDVAVGRAISAQRMRVVRAHGKALALNGIECLRSRLRGRPPVLLSVRSAPVQFEGVCYINFNNGTAVVLGPRVVDKFYFKDIEYFSELYRCIAESQGMRISFGGDFLAIRQARHAHIERRLRDEERLLAAEDSLRVFRAALVGGAPRAHLFTIRYKIEQLFKFYQHKNCRDAAAYLNIAAALEEEAARFGNTPCHGDLWKENIICSSSNEATLIDFDKAAFFCPAYDYVHYYLMSKVLPDNRDVGSILPRLSEHAQDAIRFFEKDCRGSLGSFGDAEVRLCVYLFGFLKLAERDLRRDRCGQSIGALQEAAGHLGIRRPKERPTG